MKTKQAESNTKEKSILRPIFFVLILSVIIFSISNLNTKDGSSSEWSKQLSDFFKGEKHTYKLEVNWIGQSPTPVIHYNLSSEQGTTSMNNYTWIKNGTFRNKANFEAVCQHHAVFFRLYIDNKLVKEASPMSRAVSLKYQFKSN